MLMLPFRIWNKNSTVSSNSILIYYIIICTPRLSCLIKLNLKIMW